MFESYSTASGPTGIIGLDLHTVWEVQADQSYRIDHDRSIGTSRTIHEQGGTGLIAVRTLAGTGEICLSDNTQIIAQTDTLILLDWESLQQYRCQETRWHFWWFEFHAWGPVNFNMRKSLPARQLAGENHQFAEICSLLRKHNLSQRQLASARFTAMLYEWLAESGAPSHDHPYHQVIEQVIDRMHQHLDQPLTVSKMADITGLSIRHFRTLFETTTGLPPKKYYQRLRLYLARELLRQNRLTITQVAQRLGFSSPFHFSREFLGLFGISPSQCKSDLHKQP